MSFLTGRPGILVAGHHSGTGSGCAERSRPIPSLGLLVARSHRILTTGIGSDVTGETATAVEGN